jgi:hypothetical protein
MLAEYIYNLSITLRKPDDESKNNIKIIHKTDSEFDYNESDRNYRKWLDSTIVFPQL